MKRIFLVFFLSSMLTTTLFAMKIIHESRGSLDDNKDDGSIYFLVEKQVYDAPEDIKVVFQKTDGNIIAEVLVKKLDSTTVPKETLDKINHALTEGEVELNVFPKASELITITSDTSSESYQSHYWPNPKISLTDIEWMITAVNNASGQEGKTAFGNNDVLSIRADSIKKRVTYNSQTVYEQYH